MKLSTYLILVVLPLFHYSMAQDTIINTKKVQLNWLVSDFDLHKSIEKKEDSLKYMTSYKSFSTNINDLYLIRGYYGSSEKLKVEGFSMSISMKKSIDLRCKRCYSYKKVGSWKYYSSEGNLWKIEYYDDDENVIKTTYNKE